MIYELFKINYFYLIWSYNTSRGSKEKVKELKNLDRSGKVGHGKLWSDEKYSF